MVEIHHRKEEMQHSPAPRSRQMMKVATAATACGSFLVLSGLMLTGTVIALTMATPLLLIFSPVLVPAVITVFVLATGFFASGGFGFAAVAVLSWMYKFVKRGGEDSIDQTKQPLAHKARARDEKQNLMGHL